MITSRRGFLRSLGTGAAAGIALPWRSAGAEAFIFDSPPLPPNGDFIRLYSNENAYGPSPKVANAIKSSLGGANRYPRMEYGSLTERIASFHQVKPEQILLGCGSTEVLRMAAFAFLGSGKQLIQALPTFEAVEHYARAAGADVIPVHLTANFSHDLGAMLAHATESTTLVYICNPNNPTASLTPRKELEDFIGKLPASTYVVIDEAYHHYVGRSATYASFIDNPLHDARVIVTRTFSKIYALAGLRLGYAVAAPNVVQQMRKFATEDNINAVVTQAAAAALDDTDQVNESIQRNADDRQEFFNHGMLRSLKPIDSHTNFVMMNTFHPADQLIQDFRKNKILIGRRFPTMETYVRVSLGRPEEMQAFWRVWDTLPYLKDMASH
jgi:histidinol-phosphate aminotransferase